jgi:fumarate hydratase class I
VRLYGRVFTGRDRLHKHLRDGGCCPVDLRDGCLYHCGPICVRQDNRWQIHSAGPTTSARQEPYTPWLLEHGGVRVLVGKGGMGDGTRKACMTFGCVYLQAVGGAAAVLAGAIERVDGVHFLREFGQAEALWELEVNGLEAVVAIDARGRSLYRRVANASRRALKELLG